MGEESDSKFFVLCDDGKYHELHDATEEINNSYSNAVIDKSQRVSFEDFDCSISFKIDEDRIRMANAKDVTPEEETWKQ